MTLFVFSLVLHFYLFGKVACFYTFVFRSCYRFSLFAPPSGLFF